MNVKCQTDEGKDQRNHSVYNTANRNIHGG